jgi:hypothetical protein
MLKVRNKRLYAKVRKFIIATTELLQKIEAKEGLPRRTKYVFKEGGFEASEEAETDFFPFIFRHSKEIDELPEFVDCAKYIFNNPTTRKQIGGLDKDGQPVKEIPFTLDYFRMLYSLLGTYLTRIGNLRFEDGSFEELYKEFERYFYISVLPYNVSAPILGLFGTIEKVDFSNNLRLRRFLDTEKDPYIRLLEFPFGFHTGLSAYDIASAQYMIETTYYHKRGTTMDPSSCEKEFTDVMTAMRVFKSGRVGFPISKTEEAVWAPHSGRYFGQSRLVRIFPNSYELNESERIGLLRLWKRLKIFKQKVGSFESGKYVNIALKRFNSGIDEDDFEDKIIDFLIAFEALYLLEPEELTYRLSNRVAILVGETDDDAEEIRKFMIKAYDLRSDIVHGKDVRPIKIEGKIIERNDFVKRIEEYLCVSLRLFIVLARIHRKQANVLKILDKSLIDAKSRRELRRMKTRM